MISARHKSSTGSPVLVESRRKSDSSSVSMRDFKERSARTAPMMAQFQSPAFHLVEVSSLLIEKRHHEFLRNIQRMRQTHVEPSPCSWFDPFSRCQCLQFHGAPTSMRQNRICPRSPRSRSPDADFPERCGFVRCVGHGLDGEGGNRRTWCIHRPRISLLPGRDPRGSESSIVLKGVRLLIRPFCRLSLPASIIMLFVALK